MPRTTTRSTSSDRRPFHVTLRDFDKANGRRVEKVWASSREEAYQLGRLFAFNHGLLPDVLDVKARGR